MVKKYYRDWKNFQESSFEFLSQNFCKSRVTFKYRNKHPSYGKLYLTNDNKSYFIKLTNDFLIIFIPSIGYFFQAMKFKQTKSTKGFAKFLCFLLLLANILRVFFWFGKKFSIALLYQAIVVIINNKSNIFNSYIFQISR